MKRLSPTKRPSAPFLPRRSMIWRSSPSFFGNPSTVEYSWASRPSAERTKRRRDALHFSKSFSSSGPSLRERGRAQVAGRGGQDTRDCGSTKAIHMPGDSHCCRSTKGGSAGIFIRSATTRMKPRGGAFAGGGLAVVA